MHIKSQKVFLFSSNRHNQIYRYTFHNMIKNKPDMTNGSLLKGMLFFSLPLMLSNTLQVFFNMADISVVGQFAGSLALGAVGSTSILIFLFTGFAIGIGAGINAISAYFIGSKNKEELKETIQTAFIVSLIAGFILGLLGFFLCKPILILMKTKPELLNSAILYFRIYMLGLPAVALYNFGNGVLNASGNTVSPLVYLSIAGLLNVILNLFFVIVLHLDVAGVAIASIIAEYVSAILIIRKLAFSKNDTNLTLKKPHINQQKALNILKIGIPSGIQFAIFSVANLFIQSAVNSFDASMVAGNAAAANSDPLVYDVIAAFYTAGATFIAQNYGAKKKDRILKAFFISILYSFLVAAFLGILLYFFGRQFLQIFSKDEAVIESGMQRLKVMAVSYCLSSFMDATIAASRGLGKTLAPSIIVILGSCVFRIVWIYTIFAWSKTFYSLFLLYPFSWIITAIAEIIYFVFAYKKIDWNSTQIA